MIISFTQYLYFYFHDRGACEFTQFTTNLKHITCTLYVKEMKLFTTLVMFTIFYFLLLNSVDFIPFNLGMFIIFYFLLLNSVDFIPFNLGMFIIFYFLLLNSVDFIPFNLIKYTFYTLTPLFVQYILIFLNPST